MKKIVESCINNTDSKNALKELLSFTIDDEKVFYEDNDLLFLWCGFNNEDSKQFPIQHEVLSVIPDKNFIENFDMENKDKIAEIKKANDYFCLVLSDSDTEGVVVDFKSKLISVVFYDQWHNGDEATIEIIDRIKFG